MTERKKDLIQSPGCCNESKEVVVWMDKNECDGPKDTGWAMNQHGIDEPYHININYCPFCGKKLKKEV